MTGTLKVLRLAVKETNKFRNFLPFADSNINTSLHLVISFKPMAHSSLTSFTGFIPRKEIIQNIKTIQTILTIAIKLTDFKFWRKISKHYNNYRKAIKICYYANCFHTKKENHSRLLDSD